MKQLIQHYKNGKVELMEAPAPRCAARGVLVRNAYSLISLGTERSIIELGRKSLLGKARARPDLVKRVIEKAKQEGLKQTFNQVMGRLDAAVPLGYSSAGVVVEVGCEVANFSPGDRVACMGQGYASHAEMIHVPKNMLVKVPDDVDLMAASFGMLGTIALHGIRQAKLSFGSRVLVIGCGLLGLLSVQLLKAYGCVVIAYDVVADKVDLAKQMAADFAANDPMACLQAVESQSHCVGLDAVIITASTTSSEPIEMAMKAVRSKGSVVIVGNCDIHPNRNDWWHKEINMVVSKASGPGSLDPSYEVEGMDWPLSEVRWTANRNLEECLRLMAAGRLDTKALVSKQVPIDQAESVYADFSQHQNEVGMVFTYPAEEAEDRPNRQASVATKGGDRLLLSVIGAGVFGKSMILPLLSKLHGVSLHELATASASNAASVAKKFGFQKATCDAEEVLKGPSDAIIAMLPHDAHASLVEQAMIHGKALWIEKPLCIHKEELRALREVYQNCERPPIVMVGHNRRYSPHTQKMREWLHGRRNPMVMNVRINPGFVDGSHWVHSAKQGRSRIVGEMSHFIDLIQYLSDEKIISVHAHRVAGDNAAIVNNDNVVMAFQLSKGSVASLTYAAQGNRTYPREQYEMLFDGNVIHSKDFKESVYYGRKTQKFKTRAQALGFQEALIHFTRMVSSEIDQDVAFEDECHTMQVILNIERALAGQPTASVI